jgi:hypothetical protein
VSKDAMRVPEDFIKFPVDGQKVLLEAVRVPK